MSIFDSDSWEIEEGQLLVKNFTVSNVDPLTKNIKLRYKKNLYFDDLVQLNIKHNGTIILDLNGNQRILKNDMSEIIVCICDFKVNLGNKNFLIDDKTKSELKIIIENDTEVEKFTISKDLKIDGCNPNN
tara:strand:- start:162 stop:551 length:390 start_codon:yes stop_codon:yes gene_type:complete